MTLITMRAQLESLELTNKQLQRDLDDDDGNDDHEGSIRESHNYKVVGAATEAAVEHALELCKSVGEALRTNQAHSEVEQRDDMLKKWRVEITRTKALAKKVAKEGRNEVNERKKSLSMTLSSQASVSHHIDRKQHRHSSKKSRTVEMDAVSREEVELEVREEAVKHIEEEVVQLGEMFQDMSFIVENNPALLDQIEVTLLTSAELAERSAAQLIKAEAINNRAQSRYRRYLPVIFGLIVAVIVVVFFFLSV